MESSHVVVALITRENDYQAAQAIAAEAAAQRLGTRIETIYADNDAVNQTQQLVKIIQDSTRRPTAILVEPVGTDMFQVAKAAIAAGIAWGVLNRDPEYTSQLRNPGVPVFSINIDQEEIGHIQAQQLEVLIGKGNVLYIEGPANSGPAGLRTKGMLGQKPSGIELKTLKGNWTEQNAQQAVKSWLSLSTSRQLQVRAVACQNDAMAIGARKALTDLTEKDRERWISIPFLGCDGLPKTGQEWVRTGILRATVVTPPLAGQALELLMKSLRSGSTPPERTLLAPTSFPPLATLRSQPASAGR